MYYNFTLVTIIIHFDSLLLNIKHFHSWNKVCAYLYIDSDWVKILFCSSNIDITPFKNSLNSSCIYYINVFLLRFYMSYLYSFTCCINRFFRLFFIILGWLTYSSSLLFLKAKSTNGSISATSCLFASFYLLYSLDELSLIDDILLKNN